MGFILPDDEALKIRGTMLGYLCSVIYGEHEVAHQIIDEEGCTLTHSLTAFLLSWISSHAALPQEMSIVDWLQEAAFSNAKIEAMTPDERRAFMIELLGRSPYSDDEGS